MDSVDARITALEQQVKKLHYTLCTVICWQANKYGVESTHQLLKELGPCTVPAIQLVCTPYVDKTK